MDQSTRNALYAFIQNLTHAQAAAMMDVFASYVENVETDCDDDRPAEFRFIKAVSEYVALQVSTIDDRPMLCCCGVTDGSRTAHPYTIGRCREGSSFQSRQS